MTSRLSLLLLSLLLFIACKSAKESGYQGQGPTARVSTKTRPVQKQWKGEWAFQDSTVFFSNNFDGARLNGVAYDSLNHYTAWITAENTPINVSPWYAFQVWSSTPHEVVIRLSYQDSRSRYYPKISRDGLNFSTIDSTQFTIINPGEGEFGIKAAPEFAEIKVEVDQSPTWITAQELYTSARVKEWIDSLANKVLYHHLRNRKKPAKPSNASDGNQ